MLHFNVGKKHQSFLSAAVTFMDFRCCNTSKKANDILRVEVSKVSAVEEG